MIHLFNGNIIFPLSTKTLMAPMAEDVKFHNKIALNGYKLAEDSFSVEKNIKRLGDIIELQIKESNFEK